jgi:pimeloyl-ACP methyl ester carboxylesterase
MKRRISRYTLEGVSGAEVSVHPFTTEDGLGLQLTRFLRGESEDVVLLVHGLSQSSDMFIMPEHRNLVSYLHDHGFGDVWALDLRMSNRYPYNTETGKHTLDDIAAFDHPAAMRELRRHLGGRRLHVVAHCIGSLTFHMSLFGGVVDGVASLVANSVGLNPRVPQWSAAKLVAAAVAVEYGLGLPYLDPRFSEAPPFTQRWLLARAASLVHRTCDVPACHMLSFMWGSGNPALYEHANLAPETHTHERLADLHSAVDVAYFRHIGKMVRAGKAVKYNPADPAHRTLPDDYTVDVERVETPVLYLTGDRNNVFADSNIVGHRLLNERVPGRHELEIIDGYGHVDPFIGKNAHMDVFPRIVDFIKRNGV